VRDEFISVASHELKTPVTSVKMFIQVLKKHSEQIGDEKAVIHLSRIDKQVNKLTELIYDLLNVSKIQAGKMDFKYEIFDFDKSVKEIVNVLQQSSDKHKLILNGKAGKKIYGDEERIGQVVNNLVSNAIKYSPKAAEIIIKLSANQKNVLFSVKDYGIGMSKEHFNRIFERFYRAFDGNDKTFPGLGIGLYISSEIIKRHGGKLWVESIPGKGSTFSFSLPIDMRKNKKN
jgi:signal transduction histidine kinase